MAGMVNAPNNQSQLSQVQQAVCAAIDGFRVREAEFIAQRGLFTNWTIFRPVLTFKAFGLPIELQLRVR